ncbi:MAG: hypothetical protein NXI01_07715 [Gammaproteobacteria bacterium]|nr:hypothetical protein [Gammaproteobacteria bacterium]
MFDHTERRNTNSLDALISKFNIPLETKRAFMRSANIIEMRAGRISQSFDVCISYRKLILVQIP